MYPGISIIPPVLDRLLDDSPEVPSEPIDDRFVSRKILAKSIERDLSALLNTRRTVEVASLPHLNGSVFLYGLPDLSSCNPHGPAGRAWLERLLESTLAAHEPRLRGISVTCDAPANPMRTIRFRIEAALVVEPSRIPVSFDATLNLDDGRFSVGGA